jgi:DNA-binding transcriptional regulator LsrR (DeoR family)
MPRKQRFRNKGAGKGIKEQLDLATLSYLYLDESLPQAEIARRYGCTHQYISLLLAEYGLTRRDRN